MRRNLLVPAFISTAVVLVIAAFVTSYLYFGAGTPSRTHDLNTSEQVAEPLARYSAPPTLTAPVFDMPDPTAEVECEVYAKNGDCVPVVSSTPEASPTEPSDETPEPSVTPTPTPEPTTPNPDPEPPLRDCTDPLVECACDHFIGGCTGGFPPDGIGVPFPEPEPIVCLEDEILDPEMGCIPAPVQEQLPEEIIGRQIDGENGEICTVIDVEGNMTCVLPELPEVPVLPSTD